MSDRPEHESVGGRILYGGGGIVPDLIVTPETLSPAEARAVQHIFRRGGAFQEALFGFAVAYVRDRADLQPGFSLSEQDMTAFFASLPENGEPVPQEELRQAERFVRYHLEREIALQAWGEMGQFEQGIDQDRQLTRALELLEGVSTRDALFEGLERRVAQAAAGVPS